MVPAWLLQGEELTLAWVLGGSQGRGGQSLKILSYLHRDMAFPFCLILLKKDQTPGVNQIMLSLLQREGQPLFSRGVTWVPSLCLWCTLVCFKWGGSPSLTHNLAWDMLDTTGDK